MPNASAATRTACLALAADAACVVLFCALGRRNHAEAMTLPGLLQTSWPFLAGLGASWLLSRAWRRPLAVWPTGLAVWLGSVAVGMALRAISGAGTASSFVLVATAVTGLLLVGWRAGFAAAAARRGRRDAAPGVDWEPRLRSPGAGRRRRCRSGSSGRPAAGG